MADCQEYDNSSKDPFDLNVRYLESGIHGEQRTESEANDQVWRENVARYCHRLHFVLSDLLQVLLGNFLANRQINSLDRGENHDTVFGLYQTPCCLLSTLSEEFHSSLLLACLPDGICSFNELV